MREDLTTPKKGPNLFRKAADAYAKATDKDATIAAQAEEIERLKKIESNATAVLCRSEMDSDWEVHEAVKSILGE